MERFVQKGNDITICAYCCPSGCIDEAEYLRDAVCIGFIANEGLSIIENALRVFQKNTGQSSDGICGKNSWIAISTHMKENTFAA